MIARALKPQTVTITMESTAAAGPSSSRGARGAGGVHNIIIFTKRFLYLCFGFASQSTKQFSYLWMRKVFVNIFQIQKVFVSFEGSHPKDFCIFSMIFWIKYGDVTQYPPLEPS